MPATSSGSLSGNLRKSGKVLAFLIGTVVLSHAVGAGDTETIRQYQFARSDNDSHRLVLMEVDRPTPGRTEVLVRVRAASLNRRDLSMLNSPYRSRDLSGGIPLSDGTGEVLAVGPDVTRFEVHDRVATIFFPKWIDGDRTAEALNSVRGGNSGGVLSEVIVTDEQSLVAIPDYLSFEEAATLPVAALTAWVGLFRYGGLQPEDFVLLEGTGGVSVFGLQFAAAAGARPIITSSSDDKLARARELGAFGTVNYRSNPDWQREVRALTGDAGVKHVLEVGGEDTLPKALEALAFDGHIALIGALSGVDSSVSADALIGLGARVTGIYVGSRADFEAMNEFLNEHRIRPVIDRVFDFEQAPRAFELMENESFLGKIVIQL